VRQTPAAGTALAVGQACTLRMGEIAQLIEDARRAKAADDAKDAALVASSRPAPAPARAIRRRR
jgi:hypothetical protein